MPDPKDWPFLDRLTFIIELGHYPVELRAGLIAERGLTVSLVEGWRADARKQLPYLPRPKGRAAKPR